MNFCACLLFSQILSDPSYLRPGRNIQFHELGNLTSTLSSTHPIEICARAR